MLIIFFNGNGSGSSRLCVEYLREGDAEGNSSDDSHVALYGGRHQLITALQKHTPLAHSSSQPVIPSVRSVRAPDLRVDFTCSQSCVLQVGSAAVGEAHTTAGGNPADRKVHAAEPTGVVINSTAVQLRRRGEEDRSVGVKSTFRGNPNPPVWSEPLTLS